MALGDFRKALDTVEIWVIIESLRNARLDQCYINLIENIYMTSTMSIKLIQSYHKINGKKEVRQGELNISKRIEHTW